MFGYVERLMTETDDRKFNKLYAKVQKYENFCDSLEIEIANYLSDVSQGKLSDFGRKRVRSMLKLVDDLESIADCSYNMARTINRMRETKVVFDEKVLQKLDLMFKLVQESIDEMKHNLEIDEKMVHITKARDFENQINNYRNQLKKEHIDNIKGGIYTYEAGIIFNDLFSECEKLADYVINVSEALDEVKN
jgi:phosphate:Na+ symporter